MGLLGILCEVREGMEAAEELDLWKQRVEKGSQNKAKKAEQKKRLKAW